jgi:trigger factor
MAVPPISKEEIERASTSWEETRTRRRMHLQKVGGDEIVHQLEDIIQHLDISKTIRLHVDPKQADFMVTLNKIEAANLPEVNEALAKSLGIANETVEGLRADIRKNLEREVKFRLLARNKSAVMDALVATAELDLPKSSVQAELDRMIEAARADLKQRGIKDADKAPIPDDVFRPQAEKRVRLGLVVAELVRKNELQAKPEQLKAHIDELAASYEKPQEVVRWYLGDNRRMAEVESVVIENNVTDFVLSKAKVSEKEISFDDLMAQN